MPTEICGHILDVNTGNIRQNCLLTIDKFGKIEKISNCQNCPDQYLVPGLIDTHVHTVLEPEKNYPEFNSNESRKIRWNRMKRNIGNSLKAGITTVRDCGHPDNLIFKLREEINSNPKKGSRIICCGQLITTPNGHAKDLGVEVRGVEAMSKACLKILNNGADFIKLINNDPDGFSIEEIKEAVNIAHKHGKKVACHIYQLDALHRAIAAGVDTIEHFSNTTEKDVDNILIKKMIVTPTYAGAMDAVSHPESNTIGGEDIESLMGDSNFNSWVNDLAKGIKILIKKQVPMATGSDAGFLYTDFQTILREIISLIKLGCPNLSAIQAATINAAKVLGIEKNFGSIEINKCADIVVYKDNPLSNIQTIFSPIAIYKSGIKI